MLRRGELDGLVTLDAFGGTSGSVPVAKIGSSDFYFAVNNERNDLLAELNTAMNRILDEDHFYTRQLYEKYIRASGANLFLNAGERSWLEQHGAIRVGYQDDYLAFCARDSVTGELTGALRDYLNEVSGCFKNAHLDFEVVAYPNAEAAMEALAKGEVDCMFPSNLSTADGEARGFVMTPPVMKTEVYAVVRRDEQGGFAELERVMTAGEQHDPNYDAVIMDHSPDWFMTEYPSMDSCLRAVANRNADCVLISNYQYNDIGRLCEKYNLTALSTGKEVEYYIAVNSGDKELYSILTRASGIVILLSDKTL